MPSSTRPSSRSSFWSAAKYDTVLVDEDEARLVLAQKPCRRPRPKYVIAPEDNDQHEDETMQDVDDDADDETENYDETEKGDIPPQGKALTNSRTRISSMFTNARLALVGGRAPRDNKDGRRNAIAVVDGDIYDNMKDVSGYGPTMRDNTALTPPSSNIPIRGSPPKILHDDSDSDMSDNIIVTPRRPKVISEPRSGVDADLDMADDIVVTPRRTLQASSHPTISSEPSQVPRRRISTTPRTPPSEQSEYSTTETNIGRFANRKTGIVGDLIMEHSKTAHDVYSSVTSHTLTFWHCPDDEPLDSINAGRLEACTIDRSLKSNPSDSQPIWKSELLTPGSDTRPMFHYDAEDEEEESSGRNDELQVTMQHIFLPKTGMPRRPYTTPATLAQLTPTQPIHFILVFLCETPYHGTGLAQAAMRHYLHAILPSTLPILQRKGGSIPVMLSPGAITTVYDEFRDRKIREAKKRYGIEDAEDVTDAVAGVRSLNDVRDVLIRSYGKSGFETWTLGKGRMVSIMGVWVGK